MPQKRTDGFRVVVAGAMRRIFTEEQWQALEQSERKLYRVLGIHTTRLQAARHLQNLAKQPSPGRGRQRSCGS